MVVSLWELKNESMTFLARHERLIDAGYKALYKTAYKAVRVASFAGCKDNVNYVAIYDKPFEMQEILYNLGGTIAPVIELK